MEFQDKVVLITGGGSGIGYASAEKFGELGAKLIITGRGQARISQAVEKLSQAGYQCEGVSTDVALDKDMKALFEMVQDKYQRLDVLFINAGVNGTWSPIEDLTVEHWEETHGINARGTFLCLKYAAPVMKKTGGSIIINSSVNGSRSFSNPGGMIYASSKSAQCTLGKMAALELAPYKVRVNVLCPGATTTSLSENTNRTGLDKLKKWITYPNGINPLNDGVFATSEQVADAVIFLASEKAAMITGAELHVDGGLSLIL